MTVNQGQSLVVLPLLINTQCLLIFACESTSTASSTSGAARIARILTCHRENQNRGFQCDMPNGGSHPIYFTAQMEISSTLTLIATPSMIWFSFSLVLTGFLAFGIDDVYNRGTGPRVHSALWTLGGFGLSVGSLAMNSVTNLLCFVLGAAATAVFVALLPPSSPLPHAIADLGMRKLSTVAAASDDGLAELLRSASMEDKTVILTFANDAHAQPGSLLQILLDSLRTGVRTQPLLKHLVVVATDPKGLERCRRMHPLCHLLAANGMAANGTGLMFYDKDYVDMMWARNRFQARVLALGYAFLFTDLDILWFRNPLLRIPVGADITLGCDNHFGSNPYDLDKAANGGFVYARPTAASLAFFRDWYEARTRWPGENDQVVFREMKHELAARHGATVHLVDTTYFHSACEAWKKFNFHEICIFHAACIHGLQDKINRLNAVLGEWRQFQAQQLLLGANSTALTY